MMKKLLCAALICAPLSANAMLLELTHTTRLYELGQTVTFTARVDTTQVISNDSAPYTAPIFGASHIDPALSIGVTQATLAIDGTDVLWATGGQFGLGGDMMSSNSYDAWMGFNFGDWRYSFSDGSILGAITQAAYDSWDDEIAELLQYVTLRPRIGWIWLPDGGREPLDPGSRGDIVVRQVPEPATFALFGLGLAALAGVRRRKTALA
jgi:hypothetical protein